MGLDTVELVIEVEKTFGINILDDDASQIISVGQLYEHVVAKLPSVEMKGCRSAAAFYKFRRALIGQFGIHRGDVRTSTLIATIVPGSKRKLHWSVLARNLNWRLPSLVRPAWMASALLAILAAWTVAVIALWVRLSAFPIDVVPLVVTAFIVGNVTLCAVAMLLTRPFATQFPHECQTVREMLWATLALNQGKLGLELPEWNRQEVWEVLRSIIVEQLGVPPETVVASADFVRDFGAE